MKKNLFLFFTAMLLLSKSQHKIYAYDSDGHKAIEEAAYGLLENYRGNGAIPGGEVILQFLKGRGILDPDYPEPHSQFPDLSLERQFAQNRQMYHFMASNRDVIAALKATGEDAQQQQLLFRALEPCLEMMYFFFREIIKNHHGASQSGRGIYVLMHIVADSYSAEHTTRDSTTGNLVTVKGWRLSRLRWPVDARVLEPGKSTLRLLHNSFKTPGDHDWGERTKLSIMASRAAEAIRDMLIAVYLAMQTSGDADHLMRTFLEHHFRPIGSTISDGNFVFTGTSVSIPSSYNTQYQNQPKDVTFKYDRFPQHAFMFSLQSGLSGQSFLIAYGAEFSKFITPHAADAQRAFVKRIPVGVGLSLSAITRMHNRSDFASLLRSTGFVSCSFALPLINATLDPHVGLGLYPFSGATFTSFTGGADLVWNIGRDWFLPGSGANRTTRLSLGYRYDRWGPFNTHFFSLKIGFNTWHGRVSFRGKTAVGNRITGQ